MKQSRIIKLLSGILIISLVTISCSDDPASSNEDPPQLPEFQTAEPDISYFQNNTPQNSNSTYYEAYYYGLGLSSFATLIQGYTGFFAQANSEDVDFKDGKWTWEYSFSAQGQSGSVKLIAEENGNSINWEMLWSFDDGQGNSYTDYRIIEGSIAKDGDSGSWTFNSLDPDSGEEEPVLITEWSSSGDDNLETQSDFYTDGTLESTYTYSQNDNEFMITLSNESEQEDFVVFWDDEAMTGYLQEESDPTSRRCWDSNFEDVLCATVGY
ncbi:MAG: hypothetical protein CL670_09655 [Balneola sp.]|jgi:hypothetical protein|nr:hypothetical protein [Balneola sp.]MBE79407.1 hypothetical protein [Balneola sp.]|tara:strand:- start:43 stop:846 length:804 start_codon:yes stop_codon:yes gene_type:complete